MLERGFIAKPQNVDVFFMQLSVLNKFVQLIHAKVFSTQILVADQIVPKVYSLNFVISFGIQLADCKVYCLFK